MKGKLLVPAALVVTLVGAAASSCGGDGGGADAGGVRADATCFDYYCLTPLYDAAPGAPDGGGCGQSVCEPSECPPGCEPVG